MKKITSLSIALAVALITTAAPVKATEPPKVTVDHERLALLPQADQERVLYIAERLEVIAAVDRSALSREERRAMRSEVRSLKSEANAYNSAADGTVIYISSGLLIIILLLIILL